LALYKSLTYLLKPTLICQPYEVHPQYGITLQQLTVMILSDMLVLQKELDV